MCNVCVIYPSHISRSHCFYFHRDYGLDGYGLDFWDNETPDNSSYNEYSTTLFTARAQKIIEEHDKLEPLFLYLPYTAPHGPMQV